MNLIDSEENRLRILVVDDESRVQKDLRFFLNKNHYSVRIATGKGKKLIENARILGRTYRPHVAIIDVRLLRDSVNDRSGLLLLHDLRSARCVFYSAYLVPELTREITRLAPTATYVQKTESPQELLDIIGEKVQEVSAIGRQASLYVTSGWSRTVINALLGEGTDAPSSLVDDLIVQLFPGSREIALETLDQSIVTPQSVSRGRSVLMKVFHDSRIEPKIIKIATADAIDIEAKNYRQYIEGNLKGRFHAAIENDPVLFWDLGAVLYTLIEHPQGRLVSFRQFYEEQSTPKNIVKPLNHFFTSTWAGLYEKALVSEETLSGFYERIFHLSNRLHEFPNKEKLFFIPGINLQLTNPISWLIRHSQDSSNIHFKQSVTHGDFHADNLIVDLNYAWIIDFERSGKGHILRDFIELEIDIFTRLIEDDLDNEVNMNEFFLLGLILANSADPFLHTQLHHRLVAPRMIKALDVIREQRLLCMELTRFTDFREYLWGMLFDLVFLATLAEENKVQRNRALLLGAIVCQRIKDGFTDTWPPPSWFPVLESIPTTPNAIPNNITSTSESQSLPSTPALSADHKKAASHPIFTIAIVVIMMAIVLGVLWGVTKIDPSALVLTITIILLLPLVIIFAFVVSGLARGEDGLQLIRDIVLGGIRRFTTLGKEKDVSDEDSTKK